MMFPCPFGAAFLAFAVVGAADTFAFLGAGSSSEKDSHAASSRVTINVVSTRPKLSSENSPTYPGSLPHLEPSSSS